PRIRRWREASSSPIRLRCASWGRKRRRRSTTRSGSRSSADCGCSSRRARALPKTRWPPPSLAAPAALTFAPVDFERETLADGLAAAGFDPARRSFFTWLGVVPYLTEQAVFSTLEFIARLPGGAHVVFDYGNPPASGLDRDRNAATREALAARVASVGEAFKSYFETDALRGKLMALGFREVEDLGPALIRERYFANRGGSLPDRGGHVLRATTV